MITELTKEQQAKFPDYVERFTKIGLCTDPADRPRAEAAIRRMYEVGGLEPPKQIVWCGSPKNMCITAAMFKIFGEPRDLDALTEFERLKVYATAADYTNCCCYGAHDADWLSSYAFFREQCGLVEETQPLVGGLFDLVESCGWILPFDTICFASERHCELHLNEAGRLHNVVGPAVRYPDGVSVYAVNGVRVPADIIENPASITVERIDAENNAEVRRVMLDLFGDSRYIEESGTEKVQSDKFGELYRRELEGDEPIVMVKVLNSTPEPDGTIKTYWLRVPPEVTTAQEGVAWTFGLEAGEYDPELET